MSKLTHERIESRRAEDADCEPVKYDPRFPQHAMPEGLFSPHADGLFMRARIRFGHLAQTDQALEEMAELSQAILKSRKGLMPSAEVQDEIADVLIMAAQMRLIYGPAAVDQRICFKMNRLLEMLKDQSEVARDNG